MREEEEAVQQLMREKRTRMLKKALDEDSLAEDSLVLPRLMTNDKACEAFDNTPNLDNAIEPLSALVKSLQNKRLERCHLLDDEFNNASVVDLGIDISSRYGAEIDSDPCNDLEDCLDGYVFDDFPSDFEVGSARFDYVDMGEGSPEHVVHMTMKFQRTKQITEVLEVQLYLCFIGDRERWMHNSELCREYVTKIDTRLLTSDVMHLFLSKLSLDVKQVHT